MQTDQFGLLRLNGQILKTYDFVRIELTSTLNKGYNANASKVLKVKKSAGKRRGPNS